MSFSLESFQLGNIITGQIIKLEPTGVLVDFYTDQLAYVPLLAGCRRTAFSDTVRYQCISIHAKNFQNG
ncbi:MAG: hypothetical protein V7K25_02625 [Nostoc sp.]|uniref:hypothetical protein n=1 Tax=Nostoc sp. TaxID=1180 RepID=UPI002FFC5554